MRHLKLFNESQLPQYTKGEILVFSNEDEDFVENICKKLGLELIGRYGLGDGIYIIKTEIGKEINTGKLLVENYPEFFSSYERRNFRDEMFFSKIKDTQRLIDNLENMIGYKFVDQNKWNEKLDEIISSIEKLRI